MRESHGGAPRGEHPGLLQRCLQANEDTESLHFGAQPLCLRELRADDRPRLESLLTQLSPLDLRMRFFAATGRVPPGVLDQLMHIDPAQRVTVASVLGGGPGDTQGEMIGVARAHRVTAGVAEAALLVRSDLKRHGLGSLLLGRLIARCRQRGISRLIAEVLRCNSAMLHLARQHGFHCTSIEEQVCHLVLDLGAAAA